MNRYVVSKGDPNLVEPSVHPNPSGQMNRSSYLTYCSAQPLVDTSPHQMISQSSPHSHIQTSDNQSLPPMSSFVSPNESHVVNTTVNTVRNAHPTHALLTNQELNIELLTAQTSPELETYSGDPLDPTFVDALNMSQFVFDPFLSDGQSMAAQVNGDAEEAYYNSDISHLSQTSTHNSAQTQTNTNQAFGLTMAPHISDIFSVLDSLADSDALTDTLLNVNTDHYCTAEPLVSQSSQTLNSTTFLPQSQEPHLQTATIHIPATLAPNQIISHTPPTVHLTPIVISRPALPSQQIIGQPLLPPNDSSDTNHSANQLSNMTTNETQSMKKTNKTITSEENKTTDETQEQQDFKDLIEETKCFKCLICNFISLDKSVVSDHLNDKHKTETKLSLVEDSSKINNKRANTYMCSKCFKGFPTLSACRQHMVSLHKLKVDNVTLQTIESDQNISPDKDMAILKANPKDVLSETNDNSLNKKASKLRHILPNGKIEVQGPTGGAVRKNKPLIVAKTHVNHNNINQNINQNNQITTNPTPNPNIHNNHMTAKRIAWKRKLKREQGTYICEFKGCSVRFRALENLEKHHRCHSDSGTGFVCSNCSKNSEQWPSMAGHLWRNHGIDLELHACEHCSYRTYSLSILENIHKRIHSSEKNFLCDTCGKGFKNCKQLINHKVKHVVKTQSMKTYECHICFRTFTDARTRKVHLNTVHHKTRPYICSHCNHSAASRSALRTHMRLHTGEKPHKCDICSYSTSDHNSLRRHKMRHSGERKYKCPFCSYACIQSSTYKQHLKNKHPGLSEGIMFNCEFCGFKTVNQDMYGTHISEHTRNGDKDLSKAGKREDMAADLAMAPDSPIVQFGLIVGQSISSQTNTPSISYA